MSEAQLSRVTLRRGGGTSEWLAAQRTKGVKKKTIALQDLRKLCFVRLRPYNLCILSTVTPTSTESPCSAALLTGRT